ncbi:MAG: hypothetical protein OXT64_00625, partial [Gammaproteobacteria bacterium]|nr:hypothetical protein [Gammaproteobacteria bacterium]
LVPGSDWSSGEANSIHAGPRMELFVGDVDTGGSERVALREGSPAIDAAVDICAGIKGCDMGGKDFFGTEIPQGDGYDIGAYEMVER